MQVYRFSATLVVIFQPQSNDTVRNCHAFRISIQSGQSGSTSLFRGSVSKQNGQIVLA